MSTYELEASKVVRFAVRSLKAKDSKFKEILIELEADNGVYITPAHYLLVPMNEVGFAYMRDVAYNILALIQDPTCYDNVPDSPYSSDSSSDDGGDNETATYLFI